MKFLFPDLYRFDQLVPDQLVHHPSTDREPIRRRMDSSNGGNTGRSTLSILT